MQDFSLFLKVISSAGAFSLLTIFIWGAFKPGKPWWVRTSHLDEMREERNNYRDLLFRTVGVNDRAMTVLHKVVEKQTGPEGEAPSV